MYQTEQQATDAYHKLREFGFTDEVTNLVTSGVGSLPDIMSAIMAGFVLRADAAVYAQGIQSGLTLVSVQAPFGSGVAATEILDRFDPVDFGMKDVIDRGMIWDEDAPVSSALHLPAISRGATPFSDFWGLGVKTHVRTLCAVLGIPELTDSRWSLSASMGMPELSAAAAPLSSRLGLPLLLK
jgi:hypothetical protein